MEIWLRPGLLAEGFSEDEVRGLLRAGELTAVRRGAYVVGSSLPDDRHARHLLQVQAAMRAWRMTPS